VALDGLNEPIAITFGSAAPFVVRPVNMNEPSDHA
jgi:hypothetical protein